VEGDEGEQHGALHFASRIKCIWPSAPPALLLRDTGSAFPKFVHTEGVPRRSAAGAAPETATPVTAAGGISTIATGVTRADAIILPAPLPDFSPSPAKIHGSGQPFSVSCSTARVRV